MIKNKLLAGILAVACSGCGSDMREVSFVYFNLSTNTIEVLDIGGIPPDATPGILTPTHSETNRLEEAGTSIWRAVHIANQIKIRWQEGGDSHELDLSRDDLGIPAVLDGGKVQFSYLGDGKWRVRRL